MSDLATGAMRNCAGCGSPLSRYNTGKYCQACVSAGRNTSPSRQGDNRLPLVDWGRLAQLRHDRGWTQEMPAGYAGLSTELVRKLEQGARKSARLSTLNALAQALNVPVGVLLAGNPAAEPSLEPAPLANAVRKASRVNEPEQTTLLHALTIERHCYRFGAFEAQFRKAARELADCESNSRFAKLTVSSRQWERWNKGSVKTQCHLAYFDHASDLRACVTH